MGANDDIQTALDNHLNTAGLGLSIAWENTSFTPLVGTAYLKVSMLPGETTQATMGAGGGLNLNKGIYQVTACYPSGAGSGSARETADDIISHFKRGSSLSEGEVTVRVERAWRGPAQTEPDWFQIPVSIAWFAFTANS